VYDTSCGKISGALKNIKGSLPDRILFANPDGSNISMDEVLRMAKLPDSDLRPHQIFAKDFDLLAKEIKHFIS